MLKEEHYESLLLAPLDPLNFTHNDTYRNIHAAYHTVGGNVAAIERYLRATGAGHIGPGWSPGIRNGPPPSPPLKKGVACPP